MFRRRASWRFFWNIYVRCFGSPRRSPHWSNRCWKFCSNSGQLRKLMFACLHSNAFYASRVRITKLVWKQFWRWFLHFLLFVYLLLQFINLFQFTNNKIFIPQLMYIKYVENSKFVSPNSMRGINFMRRSLVEIYLLDTSLSYSHAFLYIRQLAIQLRNAITIKKKVTSNINMNFNWKIIKNLKLFN